MKLVKRLLIIAAVLFVILLGAAIAIPYFFKDDILALAKEEINNNVNATVDFKDLELSLLRHFPDFNLRLQQFSVIGKEEFDGITLASGDYLDFTLDLWSVISSSKPIQIESIHLEKPAVNVYVLENGKANYDITLPSETSTPEESSSSSSTPFLIKLKSYSLSNGNVLYDDKSTNTYLKLDGINHSGSGKFTETVYDLDTKTDIDGITVNYESISYLNKAKASLDATFNIDQENSKYSFKENALQLNALQLHADGFVQLDKDDIHMDIAINTPQNEFRHLLSMVPSAYIEGYEQVKADGQFNLDGSIKGTYNSTTTQYPSFKFDLGVDNANVKYPDLPLGISNINTKVTINSPSSDFDDLIVDVPQLKLKVGNNPFEARFNLKTPISDPDVDTEVNGVIDLAEWAQAFPMEGIETLSGVITSDLKANTKLSYIEKEAYEQVNMSGNLKVEQIDYQSTGLPKVTINTTEMTFNPKNVTLNNFDAQLGKSDIKASGTIDNILAYFSPEKTMTGKLQVRSDYFDANEWMPTTSTEAAAPNPQPSTPSEESTASTTEIFDRFDFSLDAEAKEIVYDTYQLKNAVAVGHFTPKKLKVQQLSTDIGKSDLRANGTINNIFAYLFDEGILTGSIDLGSNLLDLNQFMPESTATSTEGNTETTSTSSAPMDPILVPKNIDLRIDADLNKVLYTNMELENLNGALLVKDQAVMMDGITANTLGGDIAMSGGYFTKNEKEPTFDIRYQLRDMGFQETFNAFNTFKKLNPIGQYIDGKFTTSLEMNGKLGQNMMPDLNSLNAAGFLQTINGIIKGFKPLQAVGNQLNISELKENIEIVNTKNWFEIKDGKVVLQPFDYQLKDIDMKIGGSYSLAQDINFDIQAKVPRKMLEQNAIGATVSSGLNKVFGEASKLGVNIKQGEFINLGIDMDGTFSQPKIGVKFLGMDGETSLADSAKNTLKDEVDEQKDKLKEEAEKKLDEGKAIAEEKVDQAVDTVKSVVEEKVGEVTDKLKEEAGEKLKDEIGQELGSGIKDQVDTLLGKNAKDIKDELDKWNPFKKKKKKSGN